MGDNKGQTIFLSVIGIATLLVAIIGATFAYFTTTMSGDAANTTATTAKIGAVSFEAEGITGTSILPGWTSGNKAVTVTLGDSDYDVEYVCELKVTDNAITDLYLTVSGDNFVAAANNKQIGTAAETIEIAKGTLKSGETKTMNYALTFKETGQNQNDQQAKAVNAQVSCKLAGAEVYYNNGNPTGTTTKPTVPAE